MNKKTIGYVSKKLGVNQTLIRLYEEKYNLPVQRNDANYRVYTNENIDYLRRVIDMEKDGLSEQEISEIVKDALILDSKQIEDLTFISENEASDRKLQINLLNLIIEDENGLIRKFKEKREKTKIAISEDNIAQKELLNCIDSIIKNNM